MNYNTILSNSININELYDLYEKSNNKSVFNHPAWWLSIIDSGIHEGEILWIKVYESKEIMAVWPFIISKRKIKNIYLKIIEPLGREITDYVIPLIYDHYNINLFQSLLKGIFCLFKKYGKLVLPKNIENNYNIIKEFFNLFLIYKKEQYCPILRFKKTYEQTELCWGKSHRPNVRRKLKKIQKLGKISFWKAQNSLELSTRLPQFFKLHQERWGMTKEHSEFESAKFRDFYFRLSNSLPFEILHYSEIRRGNDVLSAHFGFIDNGWLLWYKPTYNYKFYNYSPGLVHIAFLVKHGIELNLKGIDFLQGNEKYKYLWANDTKKTLSYIISQKKYFYWWFWEAYYKSRVKILIKELKHKLRMR